MYITLGMYSVESPVFPDSENRRIMEFGKKTEFMENMIFYVENFKIRKIQSQKA